MSVPVFLFFYVLAFLGSVLSVLLLLCAFKFLFLCDDVRYLRNKEQYGIGYAKDKAVKIAVLIVLLLLWALVLFLFMWFNARSLALFF